MITLYVGGDCLTNGHGLEKTNTWPYLLKSKLKCKELIDDSSNEFSNDTIIRQFLHTFHWCIQDSKTSSFEDWLIIISLTSKHSFDYCPNKDEIKCEKNHLPILSDKLKGVKEEKTRKTINTFSSLNHKNNDYYTNLFFNHLLFLFHFLKSFQVKSVLTCTYPISFNSEQYKLLYKMQQNNNKCVFFMPPFYKTLFEYIGKNEICKDGYHFNNSGHQLLAKNIQEMVLTNIINKKEK